MNMRMNYDTIKKHYDLYGDEIKYLVYIHYYPIVEEIYLKNNGEITKNDLEVELKKIIDGIIEKELIGVCMDTCHLNDSGYAVSKFDEVLDEFDKVIGLIFSS